MKEVRLWYVCGMLLLPLSMIPMLFVLGKNDDTVGTLGGIVSILQLVPLIGSILPTEKSLKKAFDKNGIRR